MKKFVYLAMALGLVACQAENPGGNDGLEGGEYETNYLSVNIVSADVSSRADGDYNDPGTYGSYVDGTGKENEITKVRFYFFNSNNAKAKVLATGSGNTSEYYYDWTESEDSAFGSGTDHSESVERILNAQVVINTKLGDELPAKIVAVINPTSEMGVYDNINALNAVVQNFNLSKTGNYFVMSNSISKGTDGSQIEAVSVAKHIYPTIDAAKGNPVVIYVERVLAKVEVDVAATLSNEKKILNEGNDNEETLYYTGVQVKEEGVDTKVFVKFLGWNTTNTSDKSNLMKSIDLEWTDNDLFGSSTPWNWPGIRSFWAINPNGVEYVYGPFRNPASGTGNNVAQAIPMGKSTYVQENAAKYEIPSPSSANTQPVDKATQVILAARLVHEDGRDFEIAEYAGNRYAGKDAVLTKIADAANVYTYNENAPEGEKYTKIDASVLTFATASKVEDKSPEDMAKDEKKRYFVYAVLTPAASPTEGVITYYEKYNEDGEDKFRAYENYAAVNSALKLLGSAKVWETGDTYYFFNIRHLYNPNLGDINTPGYEDNLADAESHPGYYGVVRNHVYRSHVTKLVGLGTPVYDPDEVIIPEKPDDDDMVIAAQIKILAWRIVDHGYDLDWGGVEED